MKTWKVCAGALLILLGFCAGIGFNFFKINTASAFQTPAAEAGGPKVVDSRGRNVGPLVVFGPLRAGTYPPYPINAFVLQKANNLSFMVPVNANGFQQETVDTEFFYSERDCAGSRYFRKVIDTSDYAMQATPHLLRVGAVIGKRMFYGADPIMNAVLSKSHQAIQTPGNLTQPGSCINGTSIVIAGVATAVELPEFAPPFHVEF